MSIVVATNEQPIGKIVLQTRDGNEIDNVQAWAWSHFEWSQLADPLKKYTKPFAVFLQDTACPVYNCHGLTFGSRRTAVASSNKTIGDILKDDGFDEVPQREIQPGDVIIYFDNDGEVQHSGFIIQVLQPGVSRVWSKWGKGQEADHHFGTCPYDSQNAKYYRMKRWKKQKTK